MTDDVQVRDQAVRSENRLPPPGEVVRVQCGESRCLAYRNNNGQWRHAFGHHRLDGAVRVLPRWIGMVYG